MTAYIVPGLWVAGCLIGVVIAAKWVVDDDMPTLIKGLIVLLAATIGPCWWLVAVAWLVGWSVEVVRGFSRSIGEVYNREDSKDGRK